MSPLKRSSPPRRHRELKRSGPIKKKKRTPSEFARIYGSKERVAWVKRQPCFGCGGGPCDNHHICNGGMARKADYTKIIPLCRECHRKIHDVTQRVVPNAWLEAYANEIQARWLSHQAASRRGAE